MAGNVAPNIVTDGLRLCIDGANIYSYSGTGTNWVDLTTNRTNFSLVNGPTFDSSNGGNILFDGTNDYGNTTYNSSLSVSSAHTIECWFYSTGKPVTSIYDGSGTLIRAGQVEDCNFQMNFIYDYGAIGYLWFTSTNGNSYSQPGGKIGNFYFAGSQNYVASANTWNLATATRDGSTIKIYVNGVLSTTTTGATLPTNNSWISYFGGSLSLGRTTTTTAINYQGKIAIARIYARPLTDDEVLQNYNAHKTRFGR